MQVANFRCSVNVEIKTYQSKKEQRMKLVSFAIPFI